MKQVADLVYVVFNCTNIKTSETPATTQRWGQINRQTDRQTEWRCVIVREYLNRDRLQHTEKEIHRAGQRQESETQGEVEKERQRETECHRDPYTERWGTGCIGAHTHLSICGLLHRGGGWSRCQAGESHSCWRYFWRLCCGGGVVVSVGQEQRRSHGGWGGGGLQQYEEVDGDLAGGESRYSVI